MKGLLYVELSVRESVRDVHSSFATIIKNPAWRLIYALKTLRNSNGKILIKGWHDDIIPLSKNDLKIIRKEPFDSNGFKKEYGIKNFVANKHRKRRLKKRIFSVRKKRNNKMFFSFKYKD